MTELQWLPAALLFLYILECCKWVRRGSVVFQSARGAGFEAIFPSRLAGNESGGIAFLNPLRPFGVHHVCRPWPLSITEQAMYSYVSASIDPAGRPNQQEVLIRFIDVRGIWIAGDKVLVNGELFVHAGDPGQARRWATFLTTVWLASHCDRGSLIDSEMDRRLDTELLRRRQDLSRHQSDPLRPWCGAALVIFVLVPLLVCFPRAQFLWMPLFAAALIVVGNLVHLSVRARQTLFPEGVLARWREMAILILTPTAVIRARDRLTSDVFSDFEPIALAAVLCKQTTFLAFARRSLLDLIEPLRPVSPSVDPLANETERLFRARFTTRVMARLLKSGVDVPRLISPPMVANRGSMSYCPRCDTGYIVSSGQCQQCGGVPLRGFYRPD